MLDTQGEVTLAHDLYAFRRNNHLSFQGLSWWLDLPLSRLPLLLNQEWTDPFDLHFHDRVQRIADATGCDAWALRRALEPGM